MKQKTIVLDWDCTLADSSTRVVELYTGKKFNQLKELQWNFSPFIPQEETAEALKLFGDRKMYEGLKLITGCKKTLKELKQKGYKLIVCTNTVKSARKLKEEFIKKLLGDLVEEIHFTDDFNKAKYFYSLDRHIDIIIDDKVECHKGFESDTMHIVFGDYQWNGVEDLCDLIKSKLNQLDETVTQLKITKCNTWEEVSKTLSKWEGVDNDK